MGFSDSKVNQQALHMAHGRINDAIELITNGEVYADTTSADNRPLADTYRNLPGQIRQHHLPNSAVHNNESVSSGPSFIFPVLELDQQQAVLQLAGLGFTDEGKIRHALDKSKWNVEAAANVLIENADTLQSGFSGTPIDQAYGQPTRLSSQPPYLPPRNPSNSGMSFTPSERMGDGNGRNGAAATPDQRIDPYSAFKGVSSTDRFSYTSGLPPAVSASSSAHNPFAASSDQTHHQLPALHANPSQSRPHAFADTNKPTLISSSRRYSQDQKAVLSEFDPFSDDNRI
ncbi:expressed protein [Batrachochytrium dendrobatidis JAM81]|uniref:Expressed protein n=1 Tax=Batrachochytrium dendrobatidis (strain JAM81 / FGSC 10211) TaxID=684364 RepID=F4NTE2_BATDJ|nr:uncharacterized protein BATDEDRAFT_36384 [Batrachochytrium dendrobatidis JAM81]EGF83902.1 expressed protein [Batrachochytrium dendrobatidis JAM81]|eukprot:XP_006675845.1 expressed protein [Batrachochytrium dendrobatidis JAM81]